jgi:hypothetical protein
MNIRTWTFRIPAPTQWLDTNTRDGMHHMPRSRATKEWRNAAYWAAAGARLPKGLQRVSIAATLYFPVHRNRDRENYYDAVKPVIDGLTAPKKPGQAGWGLIPDDTPEHLAPVTLHLVVGKPAGATRYGLLELAITEEEGS